MIENRETAFTESQYENIYPEGINNFYWNHARNKILLQTIKELNLSGPIVEVGCGKGAVVEYIDAQNIEIRGYEIAAIEPYDSVKHLIETNTDATMLSSEATDKYKTMFLLDVVEHIQDPVGFMNALLATFKQVEHILITVPARNEIFSNYDTYCGHYLRYDYDSAKQLAKRLNLDIIYKSYFFKGLYWSARLLKSFNTNRKTTIIPPKGSFQKNIHQLLSHFFQIEYKLLPASYKGSSLILVMKRK